MCEPEWPQPGRERMIVPPPVGLNGSGRADPEPAMLAALDGAHVMMMGDNPALPQMPKKPSLMDFFRLRFSDITARHLLTSAAKALAHGEKDSVVMACLLHDISNGCLIRTDHV